MLYNRDNNYSTLKRYLYLYLFVYQMVYQMILIEFIYFCNINFVIIL